ncbi:MAG: hypothetical protein J2P45_09850 [Candidatus Dormibacteraeota bacterium]|nr:hypothetical protein [Candidatus Dormibacteraeota bacterium]
MGFESANLEMLRAEGVNGQRSTAGHRRRTRVALDGLLEELEELNVAGIKEVSPDLRAHAATVISMMCETTVRPREVRAASVPELMEAIFLIGDAMRRPGRLHWRRYVGGADSAA